MKPTEDNATITKISMESFMGFKDSVHEDF